MAASGRHVTITIKYDDRPSGATRRTILRARAVLAGSGLVSRETAIQPVAAANGDSWPIQRFETQNTGFNPDGTPLKEDIAVHATFDAPTDFSQDYLLEDGTAYIYNVKGGNVGAIDLETDSSNWVTTPTAEPMIPELIERNSPVPGHSTERYTG